MSSETVRATETVAETNAETQRRFVAEVWNGRNIDAIPEFVADDCLAYDPAYPEPIRGPEEYTEYVRDKIRAFPDFRIEQHAVLAEGDRVMTHYTVSGTHDGPFGPLPPTGRSVEIEGMAAVRYANGRIVDDAAVRRHRGVPSATRPLVPARPPHDPPAGAPSDPSPTPNETDEGVTVDTTASVLSFRSREFIRGRGSQRRRAKSHVP